MSTAADDTSERPRVVSFAGCQTPAAKRARLVAWLDQFYADDLRQFATGLVLKDAQDAENGLRQRRADLARARMALLERFEARPR